MIENAMGDLVEFDLTAAKKLKDELDTYASKNLIPFELSALVMSTWGYAAALGEIEYLRKELKGFERAWNFMPSKPHLPKGYFEDLVEDELDDCR
jgi:hypothetical protein